MSALTVLAIELATIVSDMLACPTCHNGPGVLKNDELDECPTCHGEHPNTDSIKRIDRALAKVFAQ